MHSIQIIQTQSFFRCVWQTWEILDGLDQKYTGQFVRLSHTEIRLICGVITGHIVLNDHLNTETLQCVAAVLSKKNQLCIYFAYALQISVDVDLEL